MSDSIDATTYKKILKILDDVVKQEGFCNYAIDTIEKGKKNVGLTGSIISVKLIGNDGLNEIKSLDVIIKYASNSTSLKAQLPVANMYKREMYVYNTVLPIFNDFEKQKNIVASMFAPKFYEGNTTDGEGMLVIENLSVKGFKMCDQKVPMDIDHISLILKSLGRLHALSFAIKDQNPKLFAEFYDNMTDNYVYFLKKTKYDSVGVTLWEKCLEVLKFKLPQQHLTICQKFIKRIPHIIQELLTPADKYSVIVHGDCWTNNFMFQYQENTIKPKDVKIFDFQFCRLASPAVDLCYFIYICSPKEILDHLDDYLHLYYESLSSNLEKLGSNAEKLFPYSVLQEHWKKYATFALVAAIPCISILLSDNEETPDIQDVAITGKPVEDALLDTVCDTNFHNDKIKYLIDHFILNKYIE